MIAHRAYTRCVPLTLLLTLAAIGCSDAEPGPPSPQDGPVLWHAAGSARVVDPALDATTIYFGASNGVIALEKTSGQQRWRGTTGMYGDPTLGSRTNIVLAGDVVVMGGTRIHAFDAATGTERWGYMPDEAGEGGVGRLASDGTTIYAADPSNRVRAVDGATGEVLWTVVLPELGDGGTRARVGLLRDGVLHVGSRHLGLPGRGAVLALEAATGQVVWTRTFEQAWPGESWAVHGSRVIAGDSDGTLHALDRTTGEVHWTASPVHTSAGQGEGWLDWRSVAVAGDALVAGSNYGVTVGLDATTGAERWRLSQPPMRASNGGASTDGRLVFLHTFDGWIHAVDAVTGAVRWRLGSAILDSGSDGLFFVTAPVADGERVYVGGAGGFYALRK